MISRIKAWLQRLIGKLLGGRNEKVDRKGDPDRADDTVDGL